MGFWEHIDELRDRLMKCLYVFFFGFIAAYFLSDHILDFLRKPLFDALPEGQRHLYYTGLFENFLVHLKISAYASLTFLSPVYFLLLWGFISPGLTEGERRAVRPFLGFSSLFFVGGAAFAYFVLFPIGVKYFLQYGTTAEVALLTLESYVTVILRILLGFGLCFQLPVLLVLLAKVGVLSLETLQSQRRMAVVVIALIAAVAAPPDALSMVLLMAPLYMLYEGAILFVKWTHRPSES